MPIARSVIGRNHDARVFPLSIHASGRYLVDANGRPFLIHGDTGWSIAVQLTTAQIDTYLDARRSQGFTAILFNAIEHYFSSQSPAYQNVSGIEPFTSTTDWSVQTEAYWTRVDYIVNGCKTRNMACFIAPGYLGYGGGSEGWTSEVNSNTTGHLQSYGAFLATRYTQGNVVWVMGGDYAGDSTLRSRQWNIVTGIRSVRTTDIITAHPARGQDAYSYWGAGGDSLTGFNLGNTYAATNGTDAYSLAATAYGRSGPLPFFLIEAGYDGVNTLQEVRRAAYETMLSGGCGHFYGNNPIWGFGEPNANGGSGAAAALASDLNSTGATQMNYLKALLLAYVWRLLVPTTDTSLVSSTLSTDTTRLCPALASDGTFAMIYVQDSRSVTVVTNALTGVAGNVRIRLFDPTTGAYTTDQASIAKSAGQSVATGGERVIVVDAA